MLGSPGTPRRGRLWRTLQLRIGVMLAFVAATALPLGYVAGRRRQASLNEALERAATAGDADRVRAIVLQGAEVNAIGGAPARWTALIHAASDENRALVRFLLDHGAGRIIDHVDGDGFAAINVAAHREAWEIVRLLAERGADIRNRDAGNESALSLAEENGPTGFAADLLAIERRRY